MLLFQWHYCLFGIEIVFTGLLLCELFLFCLAFILIMTLLMFSRCAVCDWWWFLWTTFVILLPLNCCSFNQQWMPVSLCSTIDWFETQVQSSNDIIILSESSNSHCQPRSNRAQSGRVLGLTAPCSCVKAENVTIHICFCLWLCLCGCRHTVFILFKDVGLVWHA